MRRLVLLMLLVGSSLFAQKMKDYDAKALFRNTAWEDSLKKATLTIPNAPNDADIGYPVLKTTTSADTVYSNLIYLSGGGADIEITAVVDSVAGTTNSKIEVGFLRSPEMGISYYTVDTATADGDTMRFSVREQDWGPYRLVNAVIVRISENGSQQNQYGIRVRHFQWD